MKQFQSSADSTGEINRIISDLNSWSSKRRDVAKRLVQQKGEIIADSLLTHLSQLEDTLKKSLGFLKFLSIIFLTTAFLQFMGAGKLCDDKTYSILVTTFATILSAIGLFYLLRNKQLDNLVDSLAQINDPKLIGPIVQALAQQGNLKHKTGFTLLANLLPHLQISDTALLNKSQYLDLIWILRCITSRNYINNEINAKLAVSILTMLMQLGNGKALPIVEQLAKSAKHEQVRKAAQECLPFLQKMFMEEHNNQTLLRSTYWTDMYTDNLLRPASPSAVPSEVLLRPAASASDTDPEQLLRPTAQD